MTDKNLLHVLTNGAPDEWAMAKVAFGEPMTDVSVAVYDVPDKLEAEVMERENPRAFWDQVCRLPQVYVYWDGERVLVEVWNGLDVKVVTR